LKGFVLAYSAVAWAAVAAFLTDKYAPKAAPRFAKLIGGER